MIQTKTVRVFNKDKFLGVMKPILAYTFYITIPVLLYTFDVEYFGLSVIAFLIIGVVIGQYTFTYHQETAFWLSVVWWVISSLVVGIVLDSNFDKNERTITVQNKMLENVSFYDENLIIIDKDLDKIIYTGDSQSPAKYYEYKSKYFEHKHLEMKITKYNTWESPDEIETKMEF